MLYYTDSTYTSTWPYIPHNLTHFSLDDYHPQWMYPALWVRAAYERFVFPKLGPTTKLLVVPPTFGSDRPCTAGAPSVFCTNQSLPEWVALNLNNLSYYKSWALNDSRIVGFDPWRLQGAYDNSSFRLGLLDMPEVYTAYQELGQAIMRNKDHDIHHRRQLHRKRDADIDSQGAKGSSIPVHVLKNGVPPPPVRDPSWPGNGFPPIPWAPTVAAPS
jgi:hypothetical protein